LLVKCCRYFSPKGCFQMGIEKNTLLFSPMPLAPYFYPYLQVRGLLINGVAYCRRVAYKWGGGSGATKHAWGTQWSDKADSKGKREGWVAGSAACLGVASWWPGGAHGLKHLKRSKVRVRMAVACPVASRDQMQPRGMGAGRWHGEGKGHGDGTGGLYGHWHTLLHKT